MSELIKEALGWTIAFVTTLTLIGIGIYIWVLLVRFVAGCV